MPVTTVSTPTAVHARENDSPLALLEKRVLVWIAQRLPRCVGSDHLTLLGFAAMIGVGAAFAASSRDPQFLYLVPPLLAVNWFGDSLDGTVARVRNRQRPRYGYYVDHIVDIVGAWAALTTRWTGWNSPTVMRLSMNCQRVKPSSECGSSRYTASVPARCAVGTYSVPAGNSRLARSGATVSTVSKRTGLGFWLSGTSASPSGGTFVATSGLNVSSRRATR